ALASSVVASSPIVLPYDQAGTPEALQHPREDRPMRFERNESSGSGNRRVVRRRLGQAQAPESRAAPTNRPRARQSRALHRCPRSTQSAAVGNTRPAAGRDSPWSPHKNRRTALRRNRQTRAPGAPDSVVDRRGGLRRLANPWSAPTSSA